MVHAMFPVTDIATPAGLSLPGAMSPWAAGARS
jgi:hypothetical protein